MTATNHALSGALIGATISQPYLAIPLAFASHFVLDAIPHFGLDDVGGHSNIKNRKLFHRVLVFDALLLSIVFIWLLIIGASGLVFACLIAAGSPDFVWAYRYVFQEKLGKKSPRPMNGLNKLHASIQKQTINGAFTEAIVAIVFAVLVSVKL